MTFDARRGTPSLLIHTTESTESLVLNRRETHPPLERPAPSPWITQQLSACKEANM